MGSKEFKEKLQADKAFAAKFEGVDSIAKVVEIAKAEGYDISEADFKSELSDDDLNAVAGGARSILAVNFNFNPRIKFEMY